MATSSRSLSDLLPEARVKVEAFIAAALKQGLDLKVICTYRSPEEQDKLFAQGRTEPGNIVTHARAWQSYHQSGRAADIMPLDGQGNIWWKAPQETWVMFGQLARSCGLRWGGDFPKGKTDLDHVELTNDLSLAQARIEFEQRQAQLDKPQTDSSSPLTDKP